jgi:hypothetical protein
MEQTAVEWLVSNIDWMLVRNSKHHYKMIIEKAKEMEKEQIIDFGYDIADELACCVFRDKKDMEERYNEYLTFKQQDK